jgi:thioredoxin-related protein
VAVQSSVAHLLRETHTPEDLHRARVAAFHFRQEFWRLLLFDDRAADTAAPEIYRQGQPDWSGSDNQNVSRHLCGQFYVLRVTRPRRARASHVIASDRFGVMRQLRKTFTAAAAVMVATLFSAATCFGEVRWQTRLSEASERALPANKPMLVEFWAKECGPCGAMDATVFSDERVILAMSTIIAVRVDVDLDQGTRRKYNIRGTPTLLLTDSYGNELFRHTGMVSLDQMLRLLDEMPGDVTKINRLSAALVRNKDDFATLEALGHELRAARLYRSSNGYYSRALRTPEAGQRGTARAGILLAAGRNHIELEEFTEATRKFERCVREHRGTSAAAEAASLLAAR